MKIDHCAMGWGLYPQCGYSDGTVIFSKSADMTINRDYYRHDPENLHAWPVDPVTGNPIPQRP